MNRTPLIPMVSGTLDGQPQRLVDARLLHDFLGVGKDFTSWIKLRIRQYGFEHHRDYLLTQTGEQLPSGTKWRSDYLLTLGMAKELAMVERTPKGREARRYFIDCEQQLKAQSTQSTSSTSAEGVTSRPAYPVAIDLLYADIHAVNRQAWADVAGENTARFHIRREQLLRQQRLLRHQAAHRALFEYHCPAWAR